MLSILRWGGVIALTFYTSLLYRSIPLALAGYVQIVLLVAAGLFLLYRMRTFSGRMHIPVSVAECGHDLTVRFVVENKSFLPCPKFRICLEQGSYFLINRRRKWISGGMALAGENSYDYSIRFQNYGSYRLRLVKIRIYDFTGLFYLNQTVNSCGSVQIFPEIQETGVHLTEAVRNFCGEADVYDDFRPGHDSSELYGFRPFCKGDRIQGIHWKLSARMDELLVKEVSMPKACPVVFLLDYRPAGQRDEKKVNVYLALLAGISFSMMDAGCPHYVSWYSGRMRDVVRVRVDDEESLYLFLGCYLEETFQDTGRNLPEAYREKYRGEYCLHTLLLNESLELRKNRDKIAEFNRKDWKEQLRGLELVL